MSDQRLHTKRRRNLDRRRVSESRQTAIEICRSNLHLAVLHQATGKGPDTIVTRTVSWRKEAASYYSETAIKELTDAFRMIVAEEKLTGSKLRVTLSGDLCVTRVVTGAADFVRREIAQLEDRSQLYLSLGPGQKAIAGSVQQLDVRHQHALLTVANQKTLDVLVHVADTVGMRIETIEPSLVSLSRFVGRLAVGDDEPHIVIYLDDDSIELGICHDGRLLLDYRPAGRFAPKDAAAVVRQHLARLQRYCDRNFNFLTKPLRHVFVSGPAESVQSAVASFGHFEELDAEVLEPKDADAQWKYADGPAGCDMAAALGAISASQREEADLKGPNLMEQMIAQAREPMRPFLIKALLPLVAVLLIAVTLFVFNKTEQGELQTIHDQLNELVPARRKTTELRLTMLKADKMLTHLRQVESKLTKTSEASVVSIIGRCMPDDVWLDRMAFQDQSHVTLSGASHADGGIYEFVRWLEKAPGLDQVALGGTRAGRTPNGPATTFDIEFALVKTDD